MMKLDLKPAPRILRQFAFIAVVGLALLAALVLRLCGVFEWNHPVFLAAIAIGVIQFLLHEFVNVVFTRVLYVVLMVVALPFGFVISHVLMAAIFFLVITPIGLVFRLIGRDALGRRLEPNQASYWHSRGPARDPSSYFKLY